MKKFFISVYKETKLILRDIEGVLIIFIMPVILVIVVTLLEDKSFNRMTNQKMPVVILDYDNNKLSNTLIDGIKESNTFEITTITGINSADSENMKKNVAEGIYKIGILIPDNVTETIKKRATAMVRQFGGDKAIKISDIEAQSEIELYFDPLVKESFRDLAKSELIRFSLMSEMKIYFETFSEALGLFNGNSSQLQFSKKPAIKFNEKDMSEYTSGLIPNSVQHNVPAWILFGMFLICIPIAGNIIKERGEGCLARLKTMPVNYFQIMSGKIVVFTALSLIQAGILISLGIFVMPLLNLPQLQLGNNWHTLVLVSLASGIAATSFGVFLGSVSSTHMQASALGTMSSVIFAAVGGAWIPVMVMPPLMQKISAFSPMNWGIHGYYEVFLRNAGIAEVLPDTAKLLAFSAVALTLSVIFRKYKKMM